MDQTNAEKLDIYQFGKQLIRTNDLDPVYVVVWEAMQSRDLEGERLHQYLLAYFCFYHVGTASWIVSQPDYWQAMETAAGSKEYPRSSERRHFRGENARKSVEYLKARGISSLFDPLLEGRLDESPWNASQVINTVKEWVGFGPWIAFKVADMLERLGLQAVEFSTAVVMYDSPQKAAELLWRMEHPGEGFRAPNKDEGEWAMERILSTLGRAKINPIPGAARLPSGDQEHVLEMQRRLANWAPPRYERPLGPQEAETILCKWKSYQDGHYELGEDIEAVRSGLLRFAKCKLSQALYKAGRRGGLWR